MQLKLHPEAGPLLVEPEPACIALDKRLIRIPPKIILTRIPQTTNDFVSLLVDHDYTLNALAHDYVAVREAIAAIGGALLGEPVPGFPERPELARARAALADLEARLLVPTRQVDDDADETD